MSTKEKFTGIFPALVTPFDSNGKCDPVRMQRLVEKLSKSGVNGFYVGGSTGESYLLSMDEREYMLEAAKEACPSTLKIIANIGMLATLHSIRLARHAEKLGVSAISSVPPFYFQFSMEEYVRYYADLADAVDVPVLVYNIPAMSGVKFDGDDLERLLKNPKILGLKHTSYDLFQLQMLIQNHQNKTFFVGHDELFLSALAIGTTAGIGSTFNIMPEKFIALMDAYQNDRREEAIAIQGEVNKVVNAICKVGVFKGIKAILQMQGCDCGICREPFAELDDEQKAMLRNVAEETGLI